MRQNGIPASPHHRSLLSTFKTLLNSNKVPVNPALPLIYSISQPPLQVSPAPNLSLAQLCNVPSGRVEHVACNIPVIYRRASTGKLWWWKCRNLSAAGGKWDGERNKCGTSAADRWTQFAKSPPKCESYQLQLPLWRGVGSLMEVTQWTHSLLCHRTHTTWRFLMETSRLWW